MASQENIRQKKHRRAKVIGGLITVVLHALLVVLAIYTIVWSPPDPPIPQYGIEVDFGEDDAIGGSEDTRSKAPANDNESLDEAKPIEEIKEEVQTKEEEPEPIPEPVEKPPVVEEELVEEEAKVPEPAEPEPELDTEVKIESTEPEEKKEAEKTPEEPIKPKEEVKEKAPELNEDALLTPPSKSGGEGTANEHKANNNGKAKEGIGDAGSKEGEVNKDAILDGKFSGKGGSALDMPGWRWIDAPEVKDNSSATGKIVFELQIDDVGEVVSVKTIFRSVPATVVAHYKAAVKDLIFEPTNFDTEVDGYTVGKITFIITAN